MNVNMLLVGYSAILTGAAAIALLAGAAPGLPGRAAFEEIDVQRINVREPDGTLRMTLSGRERLPGIIIRGTEHPFARSQAGIIFFNDEGSETGGLIFGGRNEDGSPMSSGSLTFDRYEQDQVVQILETEKGDQRFAGLLVSDRPDGVLDFAALARFRAATTMEERRAALRASNAGEAHRAILGRDTDGSAQLNLKDGEGRTRLLMQVAKDGAASIQFLDEAGQVVRTVTPK